MVVRPIIVSIPQLDTPRSVPQVGRQREYARLALAECAARCGAPDSGWSKNEHDVPQPNRGFHWSVSHKREWAAAVIAQQPVGIDIEGIAPRRALLHDHLASEMEWRLMGDRSWHSFFRLWTGKEAALKANGVGIGKLLSCRLTSVVDHRRLVLEYEGRSWPIEQFYHADHVAAITSNSEPVEWSILTDPS